jgi:hypothetical protein
VQRQRKEDGTVPSTERDDALRVSKKLAPTQPGAIKLARRFGDALLCVRYRRSANGSHRYTTVELIVECVPVNKPGADGIVGVRIGYEESQLRALAREHGATWDRAARLWRMPLRAAKRLGWTDRVVQQA